MGRQLVVFDFDWSFVDQDTDRYVFEVLKPEYRLAIKELQGKVQWTDLCAQHLVKLHEDGFSAEDIAESMRLLPLHPAMKRGTTTFKRTHNATFLCLSNSNTFYIDTILKHHGLTDLFQDIITNPATVQANGLLKLERRVKPTDKQHTCTVGCSANMCKGEELDAWFAKEGGPASFDRVIYVGDGGNDYCPLLRLRPQDLAFVRQFRGLEKRIAQDGPPPCEVQSWHGAWQVEQLFLKLGESK